MIYARPNRDGVAGELRFKDRVSEFFTDCHSSAISVVWLTDVSVSPWGDKDMTIDP